jgi:GNAT superfamily N-acetyltransferase
MNTSYYDPTAMEKPIASQAVLKEQIIAFVEETQKDKPFLPAGVDIPQYIGKLFTNAIIFPFIERGCIKGVIAFYCNDLENKRAFFSLLAVAADQRRRGVGYFLMETAFRFSKLNGCNIVEADVYKDNIESFKMCEKLGFTIGEDKGRFYILRKILE